LKAELHMIAKKENEKKKILDDKIIMMVFWLKRHILYNWNWNSAGQFGWGWKDFPDVSV